MSEVCQQLDLIEKDYFGLRYVDIEKQRVCICDGRLLWSVLLDGCCDCV